MTAADQRSTRQLGDQGDDQDVRRRASRRRSSRSTGAACRQLAAASSARRRQPVVGRLASTGGAARVARRRRERPRAGGCVTRASQGPHVLARPASSCSPLPSSGWEDDRRRSRSAASGSLSFMVNIVSYCIWLLFMDVSRLSLCVCADCPHACRCHLLECCLAMRCFWLYAVVAEFVYCFISRELLCLWRISCICM